MSKFREKPSGSVTLWIVSDKRVTATIESVYGYNVDDDTWQVGIYQSAQRNGSGHVWTITVNIMKSSDDDWMLAPGAHQRVPLTPAEAAAGVT